ncbi:acyl-CoA dehydrogenase family protein [Streptosporangium sp. NPDC049248]|uniref:acyl-CoA dehydrogenase family protein n=1 Tax=Streptosporangium sp. NPDC049248 TaxID=3155651 RepID=UPI0034331B57
MRLGFTAEQEELRAGVRRLLTEHASTDRLRAELESEEPYDAGLWKLMAESLGLHAMAIPEEYGGAGYGFREQSVVLEEMGRVLLRSPYLSTVIVAANALLLGDDEELRRDWLPRIAAGDAIASLAHVEADGDWRATRPRVSAVRDGEGWRVTGTKSFVTDGVQADLLLVLASVAGGEEGETVLLAVDTREAGVVAEDVPVLDMTRRLATVTFADARGRAVALGARARQVLEATLGIAAAGLACEQVGGAARSLEVAVEYAKVREQFGVPIGSFQAIKFKCADMLLDLEAARSAAYYAAAAVADDAEDLPVATSVAKAVCSDAYTAITGEMIQVLGGIGYTWEHDAHLYFKRAKASQHLFGDSDLHREQLAVRVGV